MIVGLVSTNGGSILLNGKSIQHLPIYKRSRLGVTYLPQENSVFRSLTVEENIQAILELQVNPDGSKLSSKEIKEELEKLLNELRLLTFARVLLPPCPEVREEERKLPVPWPQGLALFCWTNLFAGVDPIAVIEIQRIVHFLKERGIGVLITDHNVRETFGHL